ncbi:response regulator [Nitrososphaera sp.]|uniref:response regulator n=1 Tax=Nitrososphaera sp. TaxID=1971748 RepID=UPI002ED82D86
MNILIAEDEKDMARIYHVALESRGHGVTITYDGQECLQAYERAAGKPAQEGQEPYHAFDVVVLDYEMPKLNGLETAERILRINPDQRVVFASAHVKDTLRESVKNLHQVVELIQKPFEPKMLVELIENTTTIQDLKEINEFVLRTDVEHMFIAAEDVRRGLERMTPILGRAIRESLTEDLQDKGLRFESDEWYSAGHLQSLLGAIFGDHVGTFMMKFFQGYFQKHPLSSDKA